MFRLPPHSAFGRDRRKARLLYSMGGMALAALLVAWTYTTHANPTVTIPNPVLPTPNAFDIYMAAGKAIVAEKPIGDVVTRKPTVRYTLAQKEAIVQQNVAVFATLHRGFAYPYLSPPVRSFDTDTKYYSKFRSLAKLLVLQGQVRAEKGDWKGAAESGLDAMRLGEDIPHGSPLIGALEGISCQAMGRRKMDTVVEHLNAAQTHTAIDRLTAILTRHLPFADSIQEEKWLGQAKLMELFENKPLKPAPGENVEDSTGSTALSSADIICFIYSKKRIMHDFTVYMDESSRQARQPYSLHLLPPLEPRDWINRIFLRLDMYSRLQEVNSETQNVFLLVNLALHAYRLEHGRYPAALAELTPDYLADIPIDPFTGNGPLKYRLQNDRYVLYSVGPDGKDDGGKPIDDPKRITGSNTEARYQVFENSIGDVVAGINKR